MIKYGRVRIKLMRHGESTNRIPNVYVRACMRARVHAYMRVSREKETNSTNT